MEQNTIVYPVIGMAFLTLFVGVRMLLLRMKAVHKDGLNPAYFLLNKGAKPPEYLLKTTQHYENLLELPVLFYVVVLILLSTGVVDYIFLILAWFYFIVRTIHTYIHITYNDLKHRRNVFLISTVVLYLMWFKLLVKLVI